MNPRTDSFSSQSDGRNFYYASNPMLSEKTRQRISDFIESNFGIKMPAAKKALLEGRLAKRLRALGFADYDTYCDYLFSDEGKRQEVTHFISVISTNKTDFFREPHHFSYLVETAFPEIVRMNNGAHGHLHVWSSACSTGEEPYTIAMVLDDYIARTSSLGAYSILATDISMNVLEASVRGVYAEERIQPIPMEFRRRYLMRSKNPEKRIYRIIPELRSRIRFRYLNLMDASYPIKQQMDIIFCRNVLIYFERDIQKAIISKFLPLLRDNGYLFIGHSETLNGLGLPLETVAPTIYRKTL